MRVATLRLEDFRNYEREDVELSEGLNLVVGRNAQGKTNLLEAVHCLSGLGSPRGADSSLVREGAERALLHADVVRRERTFHLALEIAPGRGTRALVNRTPVQGAKALAEIVVSVFFGPDDLSLVKGSPDGRRRFLDDLVVKLRPIRAGLRREWERVLRQRNALLKSAPRRGPLPASVDETLAVWDEAMGRVGAELAAARLEALGGLMPHARDRYASLSGERDLELVYSSGWLPADVHTPALAAAAPVDPAELRPFLEKSIAGTRPRELERGVSLEGPQRDDVVVRVSASAESPASLLDARTFASQGDQRTAALALKLAEHDLLTEVLDEPPVLLLDDVFSELDPARREWLAGAVRGPGQTLLSTAEPATVDLAGPETVIEVAAGRATVRGQ